MASSGQRKSCRSMRVGHSATRGPGIRVPPRSLPSAAERSVQEPLPDLAGVGEGVCHPLCGAGWVLGRRLLTVGPTGGFPAAPPPPSTSHCPVTGGYWPSSLPRVMDSTRSVHCPHKVPGWHVWISKPHPRARNRLRRLLQGSPANPPSSSHHRGEKSDLQRSRLQRARP